MDLLVDASEKKHQGVRGGEQRDGLDDLAQGKPDFLLEGELLCGEGVMPDD